MGLMKWMMKRGDLGGIARSVANSYRTTLSTSELEKLLFVVAARYSTPPGSVTFPGALARSLAYMHHRIAKGEEFGLVSVCFAMASIEMDVAGIENDVAIVLAEVLTEAGFSQEQVFGQRYSVEDLTATVQRRLQR